MTTSLPMFSFSGLFYVSASKSPVSFALLDFFVNNFSVWVSPTPTLRTKKSIDVPVDRIPDTKLRLDAGMNNGPY